MKILRVRLGNLASLHGESLVDFEGPVLGNSPIFAITGRTGAGKSTLLDAICLALYGKTPRYDSGRNTAAEVESGIKGDDERNILRRGAGKGWAEVDYLGRGGLRYRARWEVQRARERPGGKLQDARKFLWKVTGANGTENRELLADRGEVTPKVEQTLGLSFHQFRHAVLLAQGEFKVFLEANEGERSQLLETITGTGIYSRLSREAHRRQAEAENNLDLLEATIASTQLLPDDERTRLEQNLQQIRERESELGVEREALQQWLAWYEEETRKAEALAQAQRVSETTEQLICDNEADFARLREREALEPIRVAWARMQDLERQRARAEEDQRLAQGQREQQRETLEQLTGAEQATQQELGAARKALADTSPELLEARRLDEQCEHATRRATEATAQAALLAADLQKNTVALAQLERDAQEKQEAANQDRQWLAQREPLRPILESHELYVRRMESLQTLGGDLETKRAEEADLRRREAACHQQWEAASHDRAAARERLASGRAQLDEAREAWRTLGPVALRERDRWLRERAGLLEGATRDQADLTRLTEELAGIEQEIADNTGRLQQAKLQEPILANELQTAQREAGSLRKTLEQLNRALASDLEGLRAALEEDQPCPLCGSTQHPWAEQAVMTALNEQLHAMQAQLAQCEATVDSLAGQLSKQQASIASFQTALEQLRRQRDLRLPQIHDLQEKLAITGQALADPRPFAEQLEAITSEHESTGTLLKTVADLESQMAELQTKCDQENKNIESLDPLVHQHEQERDAAKSRGDLCAQAIESVTKQCDDLVVELRGAFAPQPEWLIALTDDLAGLMLALPDAAQTYRQKRANLEAGEAALRELQRQQSAGAASLNALSAQSDQAQNDQLQLINNLETMRLARASLLDGESAESVEKRMNDRVQQADQTLTTLQPSLTAAREALGKLDGTLHQLGEQLANYNHEWEQARTEVALFCERDKTSLELIEAAFALINEWLEAIRRRREELTLAMGNCKGQVETLRGQLDTHRLTPPPHSLEDCAARMKTIVDALEQLRAGKENGLGQLGADDENRKRLGGAREQLAAAQRAAVVWQQLGTVIGSADGKKFRTYAQGLTLRVLVEHANLHLRQLRPRFSLRQNETAAMDLVLVDHDLGGEVRPVRSLSGGESFLVSLALALGLSNMAARDLSIDSLFIDEGFGTLDADTLQMALAVLQGLHAQGKQVGIISHVEGIAQHLGAEVRVETIDPGQSWLNVRIAC